MTLTLLCSYSIQLGFDRGYHSTYGRTQEAQIKPLRGFDRLAAAGFSEDDIVNFRRQFHSRSAADYISTAEFPTEEECASPLPPLPYLPILPTNKPLTPFFLTDEEHARALEDFFFRGSKPAAFFESGHAIETTESTVFSYAFTQPLSLCSNQS